MEEMFGDRGNFWWSRKFLVMEEMFGDGGNIW